MPAATLRFPADPALRRQLWRQWVHLDPPAGERKAAAPVTRATRTSLPADEWARSAIEATPGVVEGLRSAIAEAVIDGQLSHADRQRLTTRGVHLGLNRFEATLLVAAVQHREAEKAGLRVIRQWKRPAQSRSVARIVAGCMALEAIGVVALVCWMRG